jgi:hypothetical protein
MRRLKELLDLDSKLAAAKNIQIKICKKFVSEKQTNRMMHIFEQEKEEY